MTSATTRGAAPAAPAVSPRFDLGRLLATPGALDTLAAAGMTALDLLVRHARGDWGNLDAEDRAANELALRSGARLFSAYNVGTEPVWIITEAADDAGRRVASTLLRPDEY